jgi:hypothetical protein
MIECSWDGMSEASLIVSATYTVVGDPLDILMQLEQCAVDEGYEDIHHYIDIYLGCEDIHHYIDMYLDQTR